jgi:hypothetical protein
MLVSTFTSHDNLTLVPQKADWTDGEVDKRDKEDEICDVTKVYVSGVARFSGVAHFLLQ